MGTKVDLVLKILCKFQMGQLQDQELSTPAENLYSTSLKVSSFYFPRYRPPFGECCVCSSISFPFRDTSCVCVGTCVRVCV
jgi:hypothetical protein